MDTFGEKLAYLRNKKGYSQEEVADRLGIAKSTLGMYETNKRQPGHDMTKKISDFYEVTTDWLLGNYSDNKESPIIDDQTKNAALEIYARLPQEEKNLIDDMIMALMKRREEKN